jgi:cytochrome bd ubiquinol oxidase subunit II
VDLNIIWFALVTVLIAGYAMLDGFDFGVGVLHLFAKDERERRVHLNAIAPVWDGNEVWLLTGGGALFAAFPVVYATIFSGFYTALMLLLAALIFRAVSIEFRGKVADPQWRKFWDYAFGVGSLLPPVLLGVAFGNVLHGIPLNEQGVYTGTFFGLLNPFSILVGVLSLALFTLHGALYLMTKSDGDLRNRLAHMVMPLWITFAILYLLATAGAAFFAPFLFDELMANPLFWTLAALLLVALIYLPLAVRAEQYTRAFMASSVMIVTMIALSGLSLFPRLVPSSTDLRFSLDIYNAASTPRTHAAMLIIALIGMPLVLIYTVLIHRIFRGRVELTEDSY